MAASYNYTTLKAALEAFTEDFGEEFVSAIDTIIPLGESRLLKDLDLEIFDTTTTGSFSVGNPLVPKPANMVALRTFFYSDANQNYVELEQKSWAFILDYWPKASTTTATPKYYSEYTNTHWYLGGTPSAARTYTLRYITRPTSIVTAGTSWLGTNAGDALLYSCLITAEQFLKADDRMPLWKTEYTQALTTARRELRRTDRTDYDPLGATPDA